MSAGAVTEFYHVAVLPRLMAIAPAVIHQLTLMRTRMMTEQEKAALTGLCRIEIKRWKAVSESNPNMRYMVELMEIALAALTADPVGWRYRYLMPFMKNADGTMGWVGAWKLTDDIACCNRLKGYEIDDLYTTPPAPAIPDGWRLVPVVPTEEMIQACFEGTSAGGIQKGYRSMLAAAPEPGGDAS